VTESEWLASEDPGAMLTALTQGLSGLPADYRRRPSDRKLRLFACACARVAVRHEVYRERGAAVLRSADAAEAAVDGGPRHPILDRDPALAARTELEIVLALHSGLGAPLTALLRDVVGNPWRPLELQLVNGHLCELVGRDETPENPPRGEVRSTLVRERWRHVRWLTPAALGIARRAYDLRDWHALPILADALEEAGCEDADILHHLRDEVICPGCSWGAVTEWYGGGGGWCSYCGQSGPDLSWVPAARLLPQHAHLHGPHVRGCWSLDVILGKG
jgi:hypothetical protein